jgi:protein TonB
VKRLFLAAALAVIFHSLLFTLRFEGPKKELILSPKPLTLSLAPRAIEPPLTVATSKPLEPPVQPPQRPQVKAEMPRPQKAKKPEKPSERVKPSVPPQQEQASPPVNGTEFVAQETPGSGTSPAPSIPTQASLGGSGQNLPPIRVQEATPLYRQNPAPKYPLIARRQGYQGTVVLEVLVSREGKVKDLTLSVSSGHSVLDQAALASVKGWLFDPGMRGGEKVDMWVKVPVRFQLE